MYRDPESDPPALVCVVGSTTLKYHLSAIEDLHAWLVAQGDWVALGAADENKIGAPTAPSRPGAVRVRTPSVVGTDFARATAAASECTSLPCSSTSASPK